MKYKNEAGDHHWIVDSEKAAECINAGFIYVRPTSYEERVKIVEMLIEDGYEGFEPGCKESSIESIYPLKVSLSGKLYSHINTTTSAAAACSQQIVISEKEFYIIYSYLNMLKWKNSRGAENT